MGTSGSRFADRFHERALTSPNAVRNVLEYVLTNAEKHHAGPLIDPSSSGPWFAHWPAGTELPRWSPLVRITGYQPAPRSMVSEGNREVLTVR